MNIGKKIEANIGRLTTKQARQMILNITKALYHEGGKWNADKQWDPDTIQEVAEAVGELLEPVRTKKSKNPRAN